MKKLSSATVESVLGTLLDFRAMRKVHTRGIKFANKHVLLATMAYNLKKLMNHVYYKFSISIANVINNWLDYMKSVTIFNFDKINLFADISFRFPYSSDMLLFEYRRQFVLYSFISINENYTNKNLVSSNNFPTFTPVSFELILINDCRTGSCRRICLWQP